MKDIAGHVANVVKDEIAQQCSANGIGKDEIGYMTSYCFAPAIDQTGQLRGFEPAVFVVVSLRRLLIGQPPISGGQPAYGVPPDDATLRATVTALVRELDARRRQELNGAQNGAESR